MPRPGAAEVIARLGLAPHPEGGHFRELYRAPSPSGGRSALTTIYYLLAPGENSAWHRVKRADEVWYFHAGDALELRLAASADGYEAHRLGLDLAAGERPQLVVPAGSWQSAHSLGQWTLVGCAVAPGFEFGDFELAPAEFRPPRRG
jgi:hypothetical protein